MPSAVVDATVSHLEREAAIGGYEAAAEAPERLEGVYDAVACLLGADRSEIALVENATRAWDMAFYGIGFRPGDRILTATAEYASNYIACLQVARRTGAQVEAIPNDESGQVDLAALAEMLDDRVRVVAITHVPTNGGLVNPAVEIGKLVRDTPALYLLDACQSAGQLPLNVETLGCDLLSATGRKYLRGPRGTGFLYVRKTVTGSLDPPFLDLHAAEWTGPDQYEVRSDARRFETWESFVAGRLGLGAALEYALGWGLDAIAARIAELAERLRSGLAGLPGVRVRDRGRRRCGIVSFTVDTCPGVTVKRALGARKINVSVSPGRYTLLDMHQRGLDEVVRASVHYYNTEEEIDRTLEILETLVGS